MDIALHVVLTSQIISEAIVPRVWHLKLDGRPAIVQKSELEGNGPLVTPTACGMQGEINLVV